MWCALQITPNVGWANNVTFGRYPTTRWPPSFIYEKGPTYTEKGWDSTWEPQPSLSNQNKNQIKKRLSAYLAPSTMWSITNARAEAPTNMTAAIVINVIILITFSFLCFFNFLITTPCGRLYLYRLRGVTWITIFLSFDDAKVQKACCVRKQCAKIVCFSYI